MKKEISHEEKLQFYKQYNSDEFQMKLQKITSDLFPIGYLGLKIGFIAAILGGLINLWLLLLVIPGVITQLATVVLSTIKQKKLIETINTNIKYKDFLKLRCSYEWTLLGYELEAKEKLAKEEEKLQIIEKEKSKNNQKNIKNNNNTKKKVSKNLQNEKNLVKETEKRHKNQKNEIKQEKTVYQVEKSKEIKLTYSMLSNFAESVGCSLVEFIPSLDYKESKTYIVKLKNNNKIINFEVSNNYFIGLYKYADTDLTAEWREFLAKTNNNSANI